MVAYNTQNNAFRGSPGSPRFTRQTTQTFDPSAPKPAVKETGTRIWKLVHSYKVGENFANTTAVAAIPGGCLVRTCSRNARGCAEALVFVPGATAAAFGLAQNGGGR